jgi:UDP-N-acetylglucosamine--N-acetylmuramyl-(pentapeptide) pyrophosphoryl-undecaprenol N-acetylglucosamine transferase
MVTILIAGGGTGGHVFPMVAVGEALRQERPDCRVVYVGTGRGIEVRVLGELGAELELLDVLPLRGQGAAGFVRGASRALRVIPEARRLVRRLDPEVVFSVGGYAAGPVALAARTLGVPVTLLEPNCVLGFTNRLLVPLATRVYVAFPELEQAFARDKVRWFGVPLRRRFAPAPYPPRVGEMRVLVLGGSQGAKALNETVPRAVARCLGQGTALRVTHQTGRNKDAAVRQLYGELAVAERVEVVPFIDDVASAIGAADLVVSRCGASAVAELCAVGRPAILIPYPFAADDHQRHNAQSLERAGGGLCIVQGDASVERIAGVLTELAADPERRRTMGDGARERGRPDAARRVALDLLGLAARRRARRAAGPGAEPAEAAPSPRAGQERRGAEPSRRGAEEVLP